MNYRALVFIFSLFSMISLGMIWHTKNLQENVVKSSGLHNAKLYTDVISEFRTLYSSEVVPVAREAGLKISHDYIDKHAIPLPATLSILLGNRIGASTSGAKVALYSPYPFPDRKESGGLSDNFRQEAWAFFVDNPNQAYYRFYFDNGQNLLRYAVADKMRASCIQCHNNHQESPKTDWQEGDVRGVLDVAIPLDQVVAESSDDLTFTMWIYAVLMVLGIIGIISMLLKHQADAERLEWAVKQRTVELEKERSKAIAANQAKNYFISKMGHELRTPMNAVLGFSRLLQMEAKTEEEKSYCDDIVNAGEHLLELINDVLDLARIEAGQVNVKMVPVSLDKLINETLALFSLEGAGNFFGLKPNIRPYLSSKIEVSADYTRLKQVMVNLVSNALKYNRMDGFVDIVVSEKLASIEPDETRDNRIRISVIDSGRGLSDQQIEKLFQPFERVGAESTSIEGVGIGLAICKQLVEAMDGEIGVDSTEGNGSTFWLELNILSHEDSEINA